MEMNTKPAALTDPKTSQAALRVFFRIAQAWGLTSAQEQIVLSATSSTFKNWKAGVVSTELELVTLERLSCVFRIYAALEIMLPIPERARKWVRTPNTAPFFGGASALDRMLSGEIDALKVVADYLDGQRGDFCIQQTHPSTGDCVEQWNGVHDRNGSFANDHTTL